jgi:SAM-dependent methyltransferase
VTELDIPGRGSDVGPLDPLDLYAAALGGAALFRRFPDGHLAPVPVRRWTGGLQAGDESLLDRCLGPSLDVGCGPGRLTAALQRRGLPALGIDVSTAALTLARSAGAAVLRRDVFGAVPGAGRWARLLLADGNIGIGGDPQRLLVRCRELLAPHGLVLVELPDPAGRAGWARPGPPTIRLEDDAGRVSSWFRWAEPDAPELARLAVRARLRVVASWTAAGRSFAALGAEESPGARRSAAA